MALIVADRVQETTNSTGTGAYTLGGAVPGFQTFASEVSNTDTVYYSITDNVNFEVGLGTYASSGGTITRTTVFTSSNSNSAVNWGVGTKNIFLTYPADKAVIEDASNNVTIGNNLVVGGTVDGRDVATDGTKLDTVETNADVTDTTNVTSAGAAMKANNLSDLPNKSTARTNLGVAIGSNVQAYSSVLQNTTASFLTADETKVDFITVTQAVDLDQMETDIAALENGMVYKGDWNAGSGSFPGGGSAQTGWFYYVSGAGTVNSISFAVGDNIVATTDNASTSTYASNWSKHDQTDAVQAVVGLTGSVSKSGLLSALNVEDGADVTDTTNVTSAGALMRSGGAMTGDIDGAGNKMLFANLYSTEGDLPSASTYHGMFAHVHGTGKGYFAHAGAWVKLANESTTLALSGGAMTGAITTNSTFDGRDVATDGSKLDGIEASADVTDTANVTSAGALMDSEVTNLAQVKAFASSDYATAAQGNTADAALPKAGGAMTGAITTNSTFDGRDVATDGTKLDGIEAGATADQTVTAGSGLSGGGTGDVTLSHSDTSSQSSVNNSGATVIQDVTLDTYGHVTGLTSHTMTLANLGYTGATNANYITNNNQLTNGAGYITSYVNTTYSAGAGLDLSGTTFSVESDLRGDAWIIGRDTNDFISVNTADMDFVLDGNTDMRLENDGDLHVDGNVIAYSSTISDERLKKDIVKIDNALDKISQLNGYTFEYIADGKKSAGVIAQEVEKVMPSAITESTLPLKMGDDDETEYKTVQYDQLHGLLIEAIKELKAEIEELKAR